MAISYLRKGKKAALSRANVIFSPLSPLLPGSDWAIKVIITQLINQLCTTPINCHVQLMEIRIADAYKQANKSLFWQIYSAFAGKWAQIVNERPTIKSILKHHFLYDTLENIIHKICLLVHFVSAFYKNILTHQNSDPCKSLLQTVKTVHPTC